MVAGASAIPLPNGAGVLIRPANDAPAFLVPTIILDRLVNDGFAIYEDGTYRTTDAGRTQSGF